MKDYNLDGFVIDDNYLVSYTGNEKVLIVPGFIKGFSKNVLPKNSKVREIIFEDGIEAIYDDSFKNTKINKVTFPDSLKLIGYNAFEGCNNLRNVVINSNIEYIYDNAFKNCSNANFIFEDTTDRPSHLIEISSNAFFNCKFDKLVLPNSTNKIFFYAFACEKKFPIERITNTIFNYIKLPNTSVYLKADLVARYLVVPDNFNFKDKDKLNSNQSMIYSKYYTKIVEMSSYKLLQNLDLCTWNYNLVVDDSIYDINLTSYKINKLILRNQKDLKRLYDYLINIKRFNIDFEGDYIISNEEDKKILNDFKKAFKFKIKGKEIDNSVNVKKEKTEFEIQMDRINIKLSFIPSPLKEAYEQKLKNIIKEYDDNLTNAKPTFRDNRKFNNEQKTINNIIASFSTALCNFENSINVSDFYIDIFNTINNIDNPNFEFNSEIKEFMNLIFSLDSHTRNIFKIKLLSILKMFTDNIMNSFIDNEIVLKLEDEQTKLRIDIVKLEHETVNYYNNHKDIIIELINIESNDSYLSSLYNFLIENEDKNIEEYRNSYIKFLIDNKENNIDFTNEKKEYKNKLEYLVDNINIEKLKNDEKIINLTLSKRILINLTISSIIEDLKDDYNDNNDLEEKKEIVLKDINNIFLSSLDDEQKLKKISSYLYEYQEYKNSLNNYNDIVSELRQDYFLKKI